MKITDISYRIPRAHYSVVINVAVHFVTILTDLSLELGLTIRYNHSIVAHIFSIQNSEVNQTKLASRSITPQHATVHLLPHVSVA